MEYANAIHKIEEVWRQWRLLQVPSDKLDPANLSGNVLRMSDRFTKIHSYHLGPELRGIIQMPAESALRVQPALADKKLRNDRRDVVKKIVPELVTHLAEYGPLVAKAFLRAPM